jgi:hypothetical protein
MKQYLLFAGEDYHAADGWEDFVTDGDDPEKLRQLGNRMVDEHPMELDWFQVVDTETREYLYIDHDHVKEYGGTPHMIDWARRRGYIQ